ncbi:MAG: hypothetical protein AAB455_01375 [Patescibacteria group bacterium]|mgnify:FL=1
MVKKYFLKTILVILIGAVIFFGYRYFFPNPEKQIKNRLAELAQAASFSSDPSQKTGQIASGLFADRVANYFALDANLIFYDLEDKNHSLTGREAVRRSAFSLRSQFSSAKFELLDPKVIKLDADTSQISVTLKFTLKDMARAAEVSAQELLVELIKIDDHWLVAKIETVPVIKR